MVSRIEEDLKKVGNLQSSANIRMLKGRAARLATWTDKNLTKFNKTKCKVVCQGGKSPLK